MKAYNIVIAGVGGQGTLLTSRILGLLAMNAGWDVKVSEVHGMAQRGGSVVTYVRFGEAIDSPLVEPGQADIVLAFERLEALRALHYLKAGGVLIGNEQSISPMPVIMGAAEYPQDIDQRLCESGRRVRLLDARGLAVAAGNERALNSVMLGALSREIDLPEDSWTEAIAACVPQRTVEANIAAFRAGRAL